MASSKEAPLPSAHATFDGATPAKANSPTCLRNDEHSSSEKVRLSPDAQLEFSTVASVLGGGEDEHETEHDSMNLSMNLSNHAVSSMTMTTHECDSNGHDRDTDYVNTTPMNGGGNSSRANTAPANGGGSAETLTTAIDFTATQLMLDKANIRVAELGNQLLRATSDLMTVDLEGESTIIEGNAPKSTKELLTAVETRLSDVRAKTRSLRRKLGTIKINELKSHKANSDKSTSIIASLNPHLRLADAARYLNEQMFEQMSAPT